eukprot:57403-Pelagomonas_calceolata.AAC.2
MGDQPGCLAVGLLLSLCNPLVHMHPSNIGDQPGHLAEDLLFSLSNPLVLMHPCNMAASAPECLAPKGLWCRSWTSQVLLRISCAYEASRACRAIRGTNQVANSDADMHMHTHMPQC